MTDMQDKVKLPRLIAPKSLPEPWRMIFDRDPMAFFDLVCFNFYVAGQYDNKIPVTEGRHAIRAWLEWHDKCIDLLATSLKPPQQPSDAPSNQKGAHQ